jgi:hypothetical protein
MCFICSITRGIVSVQGTIDNANDQMPVNQRSNRTKYEIIAFPPQSRSQSGSKPAVLFANKASITIKSRPRSTAMRCLPDSRRNCGTA